jgi:murein DD-endopeptidase MepM/ murein hydrolase activator NlpD
MAGQDKTSFEADSANMAARGPLRGLLPRNRRPGVQLTSFSLALGGLALMLAVGLSDSLNRPSDTANTQVPDPLSGLEPRKAAVAPDLGLGPVGLTPVAVPYVADLEAPMTGLRVVNAKVRPGDTLVDLLKRNRIGNQEAHKAVEAIKGHFNLKKLQVGQIIEVGIKVDADPEKVLRHLTLRTAFDEEIVLKKNADGAFETEKLAIPTLGLTMFHSGTIDNSLYLSADAVGVPDAIIVEMIRLFSFDVDFQREIRRGDGFEVYYRRRAANGGQEIENGEILYAALTLRNRPLGYFRFKEGPQGRADYFDKKGKSARRALMKTPVDGARLSSNYGRRKHPILGYTRMHKGADFAASWGTPIMAAGDGVIELSARNGGYGNYVRIRHNSTYATAYAHLSKYGRGVRKGKRVKQGQIIGYVGATGLAKGTHLHYEVLVNGRQVNPMTLKLPDGRRLKGQELQRYEVLKTGLEADLDALRTVENLRAGLADQPASQQALPGS